MYSKPVANGYSVDKQCSKQSYYDSFSDPVPV